MVCRRGIVAARREEPFANFCFRAVQGRGVGTCLVGVEVRWVAIGRVWWVGDRDGYVRVRVYASVYIHCPIVGDRGRVRRYSLLSPSIYALLNVLWVLMGHPRYGQLMFIRLTARYQFIPLLIPLDKACPLLGPSIRRLARRGGEIDDG